MSRSVWYRLVVWLLPSERRDDLAGDLLEEAAAIEAGQGRDAARRWLRRQAVGFLAQRLRQLGARAMRRWRPGRWVTATDLKVGVRLSARQPVGSVTAILALALAIGLSVAGFVFARELAWPRLPIPGGDRIYHVSVWRPGGVGPHASPAELLTWMERARTVESVGAYQIFRPPLQLGEESARPADGARVWPDSFARLSPPPLLGRHLAAADGEPGAEPVVVIGERLWRGRLEGDPDVVGRRVRLGGRSHRIVGVLPAGWTFPATQELWVALPLAQLPSRIESDSESPWGTEARSIATWVQVPRGAAPEAVAAEMTSLVRDPADSDARDPSVVLQPYAEGFGEGGEKPVALIAMGLLLALLCGVGLNVANLILARAARRAEELAVRAALGAPRARLVSQLFVETLVLGASGAVIGVVVARRLVGWARVQLAAELPFWIDLSVGPLVLTFAVALAMLASGIAGIIPALRVTGRGMAADVLGAGSGRVTGVALGRVTSVLLALQLASAVAVLTLAGLLLEGLQAFHGESRVPAADRVLTATLYRDPVLSPGDGRWGSPDLHRYRTRIEASLEAIPGAERAAVSVSLPRAHADSRRVELEGITDAQAAALQVQTVFAGPGFFAVLGHEPRLGRTFVGADAEPGARRVAVVSESFVADLLAGRSPLGRRFRWAAAGPADEPEWIEIVGVVPDLGMSPGSATAGSEVYVPLVGSPFMYAIVRTAGDPLALAPALRRAVAEVDPAVRIDALQALPDVGWQIRAVLGGAGGLLGLLGGTALLLSLASVYALASLAVSTRTREIGIRIALGASAGAVLRTVLRRSALELASGALAGVLLGLLLSRTTRLLPFDIPGSVGVIVAVLAVQMVSAGLVASWIPARRALRIEPTDALRSQ